MGEPNANSNVTSETTQDVYEGLAQRVLPTVLGQLEPTDSPRPSLLGQWRQVHVCGVLQHAHGGGLRPNLPATEIPAPRVSNT